MSVVMIRLMKVAATACHQRWRRSPAYLPASMSCWFGWSNGGAARRWFRQLPAVVADGELPFLLAFAVHFKRRVAGGDRWSDADKATSDGLRLSVGRASER